VLTAVSLNLHHLKSVCGPEATAELDAGLSLIGHALTQVRNLSLNLRPPMLDLLGLEAAVRSCVEQHRRQTGCDVQLEINLESRLPPELEITCYRVIQSALTNIARHAQASQISVEIREDDFGLELTVRDNGIGLDLDRVRERSGQGECFGILAMQERVQFLGGSFRIDSAATPGTGTTIHAHFPLVTTVAGRSNS
jgi:two-component system sensor histidine kinase UhpB